jgi:hypothetical protein
MDEAYIPGSKLLLECKGFNAFGDYKFRQTISNRPDWNDEINYHT